MQVNYFQKLTLSLLLTFSLAGIMIAFGPELAQAATKNPGYIGKFVYFQSVGGKGDIFVMDSDGSGVMNITNSPDDNESAPKWSPDGTRIAFQSGVFGAYDLYVMNSDGSDVEQLTDAAGDESRHSWSPDGNFLIYRGTTGGDNAYILDITTKSSRSMIDGATGCACYGFQWSPDGEWIAFAQKLDGVSDYEIFIVDKNGQNLEQITSIGGWDMALDWSPDGSRIAFGSDSGVSGSFQEEIHIVDVESKLVTTLTTGTDDEVYPNWSLDGATIAYANWDTEFVHLIDADGTNRRVLTEITGYDQYWMPDGKSLLMTAYGDLSGSILVNTDGTGESELISNRQTYYLDWYSIPNTSPIIVDDIFTTAYNTSGVVDVLANDIDEEDLDGQYLTIITQPLNGTASVVEGEVKYVPSDGFKGSDELTYQICDSFILDQKCATGVLALTVQAPGAPALIATKVDTTDFKSTTDKYSTTNKKPIFGGTASPGATIKVEIHSDPILLTTTANADGNWSVAPTSDLPPGNHTVYISATLDGVTTQLDSFVLAIVDESTIPNTGSTALPMRVGGIGLILGGGYLLYWQRKRLSEIKYLVPSLWP